MTTLWNKEQEYEHDRQVQEFETLSGASLEAVDLLTSYLNGKNK